MLFAKKNATENTLFTCIDIGSYSVKCSVFALNEEGNLDILGYGKHAIENSIEDTCLFSLNTAKSISSENPKNLIVGLSDDKCVMSTTTARIKRKSPQTYISQKEISEITNKIQKAAYIELCQEIGDRIGDPDVELSLLNSDYVNILVDGKSTNKPNEEKGEIIESSLFTAFARSQDLELIKKIAKKLKLNLSAVTASSYTIVKALSLKENLKDFIVVDIGGKTTSVSVAFGGGIYKNQWYSIGTVDIVKNISQKFSIDFKQAEQVFNHYLEKKINTDESFKIRSLIMEVLDNWIDGLFETLAYFENVKIYPPTISLTGGGSKVTELKEVVNKPEWFKSLAFKGTPEIKLADLSFLPVSVKNEITISQEDFGALSLGVAGLELWGPETW